MPHTIYGHTVGSKSCSCRPNAGRNERTCRGERWSWWSIDLILLFPCWSFVGDRSQSLQTGPIWMVQKNCLCPGPSITKSCVKSGTIPNTQSSQNEQKTLQHWIARTLCTPCIFTEENMQGESKLLPQGVKLYVIFETRGYSFALVFLTYYTSFHLVRQLKMVVS